ncbi:hypothetical protein ACROYT_G007756 [Oculina patagonica]
MSRFLLTVTVVLVLVVVPAIGLKCYVCSGNENTCSKSVLESNQDTRLIDCPSSSDRCMRTWEKFKSSTVVTNACSNQGQCDLTQSACDLLEDNLDNYDCAIGCCAADACNAASAVSISVFLLTVSSVLGLALMM